MELRIKEICKAKGITQKQLATLVGITPIGLAKSLKGNTTLCTLEKIATALNVPIQELFSPPTENKITLICPHCKGVVNVSLSVHGEQSKETDKE